MSLITASSLLVATQAHEVRSRMTGPGWHQSFTTPAPVPSWLVDVVDGHMEQYSGPDPVLFRTSGVGLEWFIAADDNPDHLEVTDTYGRMDAPVLRAAAEMLSFAGGVVDADVYVWGDGHRGGRFSARVHCLFGIFTHVASVPELAGLLDDLDARFTLSIVPSPNFLTAQVTPRLQLDWA